MASKDVLMVPWSTGLTYSGQRNLRVAAGSLLEYARYNPDSGFSDESVAWRPNEVFSGSLRLEDMERGRSAARFIWRSDDGRTYPMFMSGLLDLVKTHGIQPGGLVHTRWTVAKRGSNFGLVVAK